MFNGGNLQVVGTALNNLNSHGIDWSVFTSQAGNLDIATFGNVFTITNVIGGAGNFTKISAGTLVLTAPNTYAGATLINGGILSIASITNGGIASPLGVSSSSPANLVLNGGTLQYTGPNAATDHGVTITGTGGTLDIANGLTLSGVITNTGAASSFNKLGAGTLMFTNPGTNTLAGTANSFLMSGTTIFAGGDSSRYNFGGELTVGNSSVPGVPAYPFNNTYMVISNGTVNGSGYLSISRGNGYNGQNSVLTMYGGTGIFASASMGMSGSVPAGFFNSNPQLYLYNNSVLQLSGQMYVGESANWGQNSVLVTNSALLQVGSYITIGGGATGASGGTGIVTVAGSSALRVATYIYLGGNYGVLNIQDAALVTNNILQFASAAGGVGILNLNSGGILQPAQITMGAGRAGTFNFNGGLLRAGGSSATFMQGLTTAIVSSAGAFIDTTNFTIVINQNLGGSGALTKSGLGSLVLGGTNAYTGGTIINGGLLAFATNTALPATGVVTIANGALAVSGPYSNVTDWVNSGRIATNSAGALALLATNANESINWTSLAGGVYSNLFIGAASGTVVYTGTIIPNNGGYRLGGGLGALWLTNDLMLTGTVSLTINNGGTVFLNGSNTFSGGTVLGSNTTFSIANEYSIGGLGAALTINGGTQQIRGVTQPGFNVTAPNLVGNTTFDLVNPGEVLTLAGNINASGSLAKLGSGMLVLGGSNNITGVVTISAGVLRLAHGDALDGVGSNITVASGAALQLSGGIATEPNDLLQLNGGGVNNDGALRSVAGNNNWRGLIGLLGQSRINADAGSTLTLSGAISNGANTLVIGGYGNIVITGSITNGTGGLTKDGAGVLTLGGSNLYSGATTINAGTLALDFSQASAPANNILAPNNNVYITGGATLKILGEDSTANTQTLNSVTASTTFGLGSSTNAGIASIVVSNGAGGSLVANLGLIGPRTGVINAGAPNVDITLPNSGAVYVNNVNANGIIGPWVTVNGTDWATVNGYGPTYLSAYTGYVALTNLSTANVKIDGTTSLTLTPPDAITALNSLLVNNPGSTHTINLSGTNQLLFGTALLSPAGIFMPSTAGALNIGASVNDGKITANNELILINNSASNLNINSTLAIGANALTINGSGTVNLNGTNTYTGATYVNAGTVNFNNTNSLSSVNVRGGALNFAASSSNTLSSTLIINGGRVTVNGPLAMGAQQITVGNLAGDRGVLVVNTNMTHGQMNIGNLAGSAGAVYMNSGNVSSGASEYEVGNNAPGAYGFLQMNGGTITNGGWFQIARNGLGVFYMNNGAIVPTTSNSFLVGNVGTGVMYMAGGTLAPNTSAALLNMVWATGTRAELTLAGTASMVFSNDLKLNANAAGTAIVNLNGGTLSVNHIYKNVAGGLNIFNFNGGLLRTTTNGAALTFMGPGSLGTTGALDAAYIYSNGAFLDITNNTVTINQSLLGPTGYGVSGILVGDGGSGYIGAPAITLSGGSGTGATAIAQMDLTSGTVTNILITSTGSGYLPNDTVIATISGGGYIQSATLSNITLTANANTGGLTQYGTGTLILTGTNTYGGNTTISNGVLVIATAGATNTLNNVSGGGQLQQSGTGVTILNGSSTYTGGTIINTGTLQFASSGAVPAASNITINAMGVAAFDFGGASSAVQGLLPRVVTTSTGAIALTPNSANQNINFSTANLSNAWFGAVGTVNYAGTHTPYGQNIKLGGGGGTLVASAGNFGAATNVVIGNGSGYTLQAGGANVFNTPILTVASGAVFNVAGNAQTLGNLTGPAGGVVNNTGAATTLTVGSNNTDVTFGGSINGTLGLTKTGSGTLTLTNSSFYTGATIVSGGTLKLAPSGANQAGLMEGYVTGWANWGPLTNMGAQLTLRWAGVGGTGTDMPQPPVWGGSWPLHTTIGYTGYVYNNTGSNATWTFAMNCDDGYKLIFDGNTLITAIVNGTSQKITITATPGAHSIQVLLSNNGGNGGNASAIYGSGNCFIMDLLGRDSTTFANYIIPSDTGNGMFFTTGAGILPAATPLYIASSATLDLSGAFQNVSLLADSGVGGGIITNTATTNAMLQIATLSGSNTTFSGNITDAAASNSIALWIGGSGVQVLAGTNTYRGGTIISSNAILQINNTNAVPLLGFVAISNNAALAVGNGVTINQMLTRGRIATNAAGVIALTAGFADAAIDQTLNGGIYSNLYLGAVGNLTYGGSITGVAGNVRLGGITNCTLTFAGTIGSGQNILIGGGNNNGMVILSNSLSYAFNTTVTNGWLGIQGDTSLGSIPAAVTTNLTFGGNNTLSLLNSGIVLNSNRTVLVNSGTTVLNDNGNNLTINGQINGGGTLQKIGAGTLTIAPTNLLANLYIGGGALSLASSTPTVMTNTTLVVAGNVLNARAVMTITTNLNLAKLQIGGNDNINAAGAVSQTGGILALPNSASGLVLGDGTGAYGYYNLSGGLVTNVSGGGMYIGNRGYGVFDLNGGIVNPGSSIYVANGATAVGGVGILNLNSGTINAAGNGTSYHTMNATANQGTLGVINFLGGTMNATTGNGLGLMHTAGNTGIVNLVSGTLNTAQIFINAAGVSIFDFNGGTLRSTGGQYTNAFMTGLTAAYVFPGNAIIDSSNYVVTVNQNLLAPSGYGVTNINLSYAGTNYIGPPAIRITGGSGIGATAIAQINGNGVITNILVTSAGSGYLPTDPLTVQLLGGGAMSNAVIGTVSLGANSSSGGLVKLGAGTLILGGYNTYGGNTIVSNGTLQIGNNNLGWTPGTISFVSNSSSLGISRSDIFTNNLSIQIIPGGNLASLIQAGSGVLVLTNTPYYSNVIVNAGLLQFASASTLPAGSVPNIILNNGGGLVNAGPFTNVMDWLSSGRIASNNASAFFALPTGVNSETLNFAGTAFANYGMAVVPSNTVTITGSWTPGTNVYNIGGGGTLIFAKQNYFTDNGPLTNRSVVFGVGTGITSGGNFVIAGPQSYTGGTTISNGAMLQVSADNNLGYGNITINNNNSTLQIVNNPAFASTKTITFNTSGGSNFLDISTGSTATLYGAISTAGGGFIQKLGGGTLIFSNNAVTLGGSSLFARQGTLIIDSGAIVSSTVYTDIGWNVGDNATLILRGNGVFTGSSDFNVTDTSGTGLVTIQDTASLTSGDLYVGKTAGTGILNLNGGTLNVNNLKIGAGATGTVNLNGGTLIIRGAQIWRSGGTGNLNISNTLIRAANNIMISNLSTAVISGNAFLDSSNFTVTANQAFTGTGTLTKQGTGTLILNSTTAYASNVVNAGVVQFGGATTTNNLTVGRSTLVNFGGTVAPILALDTNFLSRIALTSSGTVAMLVSTNLALDFNVASLTNVSLGAVGTVTNSGAITAFATNNLRLGGGGGTLVITNNLGLANGTNLIAFGSGSGGTLLLTGTNTYNTTTVNGGVVQYTLTNAMGVVGRNITINSGGTIAPSGIVVDASFLSHITSNSAGTVALAANNASTLDFTAFSNLSLGAVGTVTNSGALIVPGTTYNLGGGGGTLVLTNVNALAGTGTNVNFFNSGSGGRVILTTNNNFVGAVVVSNAAGTVEFRTQLGLGTNNTITVYAGTVFANVGATPFVVGTNNNNQQVLLTGPASIWSNSNAFVVGGVGASGNSVVLSNGASLYSQTAASYIGAGTGANSNSVTVYSNSVWNVGAQYLTIGSNSTGNALIISGGTVTNFRGEVGNGATALGNRMIVTNGGTLGIIQDLYAGFAVSSNNLILFSDPGTVFIGNGHFIAAGQNGGSNTVVFANGAVARNVYALHTGQAAGGSYNSTLITNGAQVYVTASASYIGNGAGANSNTLLVTDTGSLLTLSTNTLTVGGTQATGNVFMVANNGVFSNTTTVATLTIGSGTSSFNNQMSVTNGGQVLSGGAVIVGNGTGANSNSAKVIGSTSLWNLNAQTLMIGQNSATGNTVTVNGGIITNANITVGKAGAAGYNPFGNQLIITNGGRVFSTAATSFIGNQTGGGSANGNSVLVTGSTSLWDFGNQQLILGEFNAASNSLTVNVGLVTNVAALKVGDGTDVARGYNSVLLTNGGALYTIGASSIGNGGLANSNSITVADSGSLWNLGGSTLAIGNNATATGNWMTVASGGILTNASSVTVGGASSIASVFNLAGDAYVSNVNLSAVSAQMNFMNSGTLHATTNGNLLSGTGTNYFLAGGGTIDTVGFTVTNSVVNAGSGSLTKTGTGILALAASNTYSGGTLISGGSLQLGDGTLNNGYVQGNITNNAQLVVANPSAQTISGIVSGLGSLTKLGAGTLTLSGTNTYGGDTTLSGGTLQMGANLALPTNTHLKADALGNMLDLANTSQQIGSLDNFGGTITNSIGNGTLSVSFTNSTQNFLGSVSGASTLTLTGGGTLIATTGSTFSVSVTNIVTGGSTLIMNGQHLGVINTLAAATNGGIGAITTLNVMSNGVYMPGASLASLGLGTQTVQNLTLNPGGLLAVGLTSLSNGLAQVGTSFAMTNALLRLDLTQYDADTSGSVQQQFTVLTYNTSSVFNSADTNQCFLLQDWGTAAQLSIVLTNNMTFAVGGGSSATNFFTINYDDLANGSTASITLTAVPEPGTASLLGLIGVAFLVRRLRRRTQKT